MYKLIITSPAETDLADITEYIAKDLSAPIAASNFLNEVSKCYDNISRTPLMYELCQNERLRARKYRKALIKNYVMLYKVDEQTKTVSIMRFVYGRSDYINTI